MTTKKKKTPLAGTTMFTWDLELLGRKLTLNAKSQLEARRMAAAIWGVTVKSLNLISANPRKK